MTENIRTSDKILLVLNFFAQPLGEESSPLGIFSGSYKTILGFSPNKRRRNNFQQALSRLIRKGLVERKKIDQESFLRLTSHGRNKLLQNHPVLNFRGKSWDGFWRLASFDVTEDRRKIRNLLRTILKDFGFRRFQHSLYLSPFKVEEELKRFIENSRLNLFLKIFIVKPFGSDRETAAEVWNLDGVNEGYRRILRDFEANGNLSLLRERFLEVAITDPCLPKELLPDDWLGEYAEKKALTRA